MAVLNISTKAILKQKRFVGWKVYIDGEKFPKKPRDYYDCLLEEEAVKKAYDDYRKREAGKENQR